MRQAVIDDATGRVLNLVEVDPAVSWTPPKGTSVVEVGRRSVRTGDTWDGEDFIPQEPTKEQRQARARKQIDEKAALSRALRSEAGEAVIDLLVRANVLSLDEAEAAGWTPPDERA